MALTSTRGFHQVMGSQCMPKWAPCKRRVFIQKLIKLGFDSPEAGGRHFYMRHGSHTLTIPSNSEYPVAQLKMMLREVKSIIGRQILLDEWIQL